MSQEETRSFEIEKPVLQKGNGSLDRYYGQYWSYPIRTTILDSGHSMLVTRRFSDFEKLVELLTKQFPHCILPPIPAKEGAVENIVTRASDTAAVVPESRRTAFAMFLRRVSFHPKAGSSTILRVFLECDSSGWEKEARITDGPRHAKEEAAGGAGGSTWWTYLSTTLQSEVVPTEKDSGTGFRHAIGEPKVRLTAHQWLCAKTFIRRFSNHMVKVRDALASINDNRNQYSQHLGLFSDCLSSTLVTGGDYDEPFGVRAAMNTLVHSQREVGATIDNHCRASKLVKEAMDYIQLSLESACRTIQFAQNVINSYEEQTNVVASIRSNYRACQERGDRSEQCLNIANELADAQEKQKSNEREAGVLDTEVRAELRRFVSDLQYDMANISSMWRAAQSDEVEALMNCWVDLAAKIKGLSPNNAEPLHNGGGAAAASSSSASAPIAATPSNNNSKPQQQGNNRAKTSAPLPPQSPDMM